MHMVIRTRTSTIREAILRLGTDYPDPKSMYRDLLGTRPHTNYGSFRAILNRLARQGKVVVPWPREVGRYVRKPSVLDDVILDMVSGYRWGITTPKIFSRVLEEYGEVHKKTVYRSLQRLCSKGLLLRSSGKGTGTEEECDPDIFRKP